MGAAIVALRNEASVMLVDSHGYFGGTATASMVNNFGGYLTSLNGGIVNEFINRLNDYKSVNKMYNISENGTWQKNVLTISSEARSLARKELKIEQGG